MTSHDRLTEELGAELRARAADLHGAPLSLDGVRGRARSIRRRRRAVAGAAVAAAVLAALAVPAALSGTQRAEGPQPAPAPEPAGRPAVLHAGTLSLPDGTVHDLGVGTRDVGQLGVLTDGRVVLTNTARSRIEVYDADGSLRRAYPAELLSLTLSATDEVAAWVGPGSRVRVLESGDPEPVELAAVPLPGQSVPVIDAVVGSGCASGGCRVLAGDGTVTTSEATVDGSGPLVTGEELRITDVSPDERTWAVVFPPAADQQYGCVGLYDVAAERVTARSCATANLRFSPDGEHVAGGFFENNMAGEVTVLDRDLRVVRTYAPSERVVVSTAWGDATHLLAAVAGPDDQQWSLERVAVDDGRTETLDGPVAGGNPEIVSEYRFSE